MFQKTSLLNLSVSLSAPIPILLFTGLSFLSFSIPFFVGHPQWLVGAIVNASLFLAAIFLPKKFILPLIILPSLGVLSRGIIFGPLSMFLVYLLPFIWLANLIMILTFKKLLPHLNYLFSVILAATAKFIFLFIIANVYFELSIVPKIFLQLMGVNQFLTALAGGIISLIIFNFYGRNISRGKKTI
ncbi:MAG: hypothetical protein ABH831_01065 [Candidatus Nealsonbacteria bacterium]